MDPRLIENARIAINTGTYDGIYPKNEKGERVFRVGKDYFAARFVGNRYYGVRLTTAPKKETV